MIRISPSQVAPHQHGDLPRIGANRASGKFGGRAQANIGSFPPASPLQQSPRLPKQGAKTTETRHA
ncbi:MAG: hypothetical protein V4586_10985 [Pseudomonadota bacterium]